MASTNRLQVLILDDLAELLASGLALAALENWFDFAVAASPQEVFAIDGSGAAVPSDLHLAQREVLGPEAPFDIYLADMRLCASDETCRDAQHLETGLHVRGAGFLACLMWAMRSPQVPQIIVPYSANTEQFDGAIRLCRSIKPKTIHFGGETHVNRKTGASLNDLLARAVPEMRDNFVRCFDAGCYISITERRRLRAALTQPDADPNELIHIRYGHNDRPVMLGSLFFDKMRLGTGRLPASAVIAFLDALPEIDPIEHHARDLAASYYLSARTEESRAFHKIAAMTGGTPLEAEIHERASKAATNPIWKRAVRNSDEEQQTIRLSIIFGLILIFRDHPIAHIVQEVGDVSAVRPGDEDIAQTRLAMFQDAEINDLVEDLILADGSNSLRHLISVLSRALEGTGRRETAKLIRDKGDEICLLTPSISSLVEGDPDPAIDQFLRFLDPFPGLPTSPPSLNADGKCGARMRDLGFDVSQLRRLSPQPLSSYERAAAVRFLSDLMPPGSPIPYWLSQPKLAAARTDLPA